MNDKLLLTPEDELFVREITRRCCDSPWGTVHSEVQYTALYFQAKGEAKAQRLRLPLFQSGNFTLHSGSKSSWKISCDTLTDRDWETIAYMIQEKLKFGKVIGIPTGGLKLAKALEQYATAGATLIVDDVLTTGKSMEEMKATCDGEVIGAVVFARGECSTWIHPLFSMGQRLRLDSPALREKIVSIVAIISFAHIACFKGNEIKYEEWELYRDDGIDQLLDLMPSEEEIRKDERERIKGMPCWLAQSHNEECAIRQVLRGEEG